MAKMLAEGAFMVLVNNKSHSHATGNVFSEKGNMQNILFGNPINKQVKLDVYHKCILFFDLIEEKVFD